MSWEKRFLKISVKQFQIFNKQKMSIKYLTQKESQDIDEELMDAKKQGFSIDQLMEMAGMSVAHAVAKEYPNVKQYSRILTVVGPGNNVISILFFADMEGWRWTCCCSSFEALWI